MKQTIYRDIAAVLAVAALVTWGIYWNEARKDILYLCGNFMQGDTREDVVRQLNTSNLVQHHTDVFATGSKLVASSYLHLGVFTCTVEFTRQGRVVAATAN